MEFDRCRAFSALDITKVKVGSKGYFANDLDSLVYQVVGVSLTQLYSDYVYLDDSCIGKKEITNV